MNIGMFILYFSLGFVVLMGITLYIVILIGSKSRDEMDKIIDKELKKWEKMK